MIFLECLPRLILLFCFASMLLVIEHDRVTCTREKQLHFNYRVFKLREKYAIKLMADVIGLVLLCYEFCICCTVVLIFKNGESYDEEYKIPFLVLNSVTNPVAYAFFKRNIKG